jgi:3D (Asp-Asp-Asp) domain-containing protein
MIEKISALVLLTILPVAVSVVAPSYGAPALAAQGAAIADKPTDYLLPRTPVETLTRFSEEEIRVPVPIPFEAEYVDDPESEVGTEKVLQEGVNGQRTEVYLVKYWYGEETERNLVDVQVTEPHKQVVWQGTKIIWRSLEANDYGNLKYWRKLRVWATSYDGNCFGCRGRTYSGTPVRHGTLAVDPSVIPLGTRVYIPGYGIGRAEDIGGGVKGQMIDLGFDDVTKGWWQAKWTDVYLLDKEPAR